MTNNYRWLDPRGLRHGSWLARAGRLLLILSTLLLAGLPIYNPDVLFYPSHLDTYIERYADFIIDPFDDDFFNTNIEIIGGSWKRGLFIEEFDGQYWILKEEIVRNGSGTNILAPEPPPGSGDNTGEAVIGQRRVRSKTEAHTLHIRDLQSGKEYIVEGYIGFYRYSDREHCSKPLNEENYRAALSMRGAWKAELLTFKEYGDNLAIVFRIFVADKLFEQVSHWPD